jgi:hypothetical protein
MKQSGEKLSLQAKHYFRLLELREMSAAEFEDCD